MSNVPRFDEVVEGYALLADELLDSWTPFLTTIAAKVNAGTYDPDAATADFPKLAKLVAGSVIGIGLEAFDALAILTSDFSEEKKISGYRTDPAKAATTRTLTVKDDLTSVTGMTLPKSRVTIVPAQLAPSTTQFVLDVDGDGLKARTYDGYVLATDTAGGVEEIFVSVTIG